MEIVVQFLGSAVAIALLVGLVAWTRKGRDDGGLDWPQRFAEEFPGASVDELWVASDGSSALAHACDRALIGWRLGDGVVTRSAPFSHLHVAQRGPRHVELSLDDPGLPRLRFLADEGPWPPGDWTARPPGATTAAP
ncbi:hypothetical protein BH09PSE2_BH09PSE2_08010 [soil metagenome]